MVRSPDIIIRPSLFALDEIVNGRRYVGVTLHEFPSKTRWCGVFECQYCLNVRPLTKIQAMSRKCVCRNQK